MYNDMSIHSLFGCILNQFMGISNTTAIRIVTIRGNYA